MKHHRNEYQKQEIAYERVLFFSDAVVAIAITLLALELKVQIPETQHLTFRDLLQPWHVYLAFLLSFVNVASFWRTHHDFFVYIRKMDDRMMFLNIAWLFFIIILPFSTSLLSSHFGDTPAIFLYSLNIFLVSIIQNSLWDYAERREDYLYEQKISTEFRERINLMLNLDMLNAAIAICLSFFYPRLAFFLLFFKVPAFLIAAFYISKQLRKTRVKQNSQSESESDAL